VWLGRISEDCRQVCDARSIRSSLESLDHTRLDVDPHRFAAGQDTLRRWDEQSARPRADFQDSLSWLKFKPVESRPHSMCSAMNISVMAWPV
jgi:hypothetical protein